MRENVTYAALLLILTLIIAGMGSLFGAAVIHVLAGVDLWSPWHITGQVVYLLLFAYLLVLSALDAMDERIGAVPPLKQRIRDLERVLDDLRKENRRYAVIAQTYRSKVSHVSEELQTLIEKTRNM